MQQPLAITAGEPGGIGPDLCLQLANHEQPLVVIADKTLLQQRAAQLCIGAQLHDYTTDKPHTYGKLSVLHVPLAHPALPGKLDTANAAYVLETLRRAVQGCLSGEFSGIVTAPVHKGVINDAGIPFTGHTEFLAEQTHIPQVVMMLAGGGMRVALATTHLPLREVADAITAPLLESVLRILQRDLQRRFGIPQPRILVAGLNPHAGEGGHLGREEIEVMIPVLDKLRAEGFNVSAPIPADTLFRRAPAARVRCRADDVSRPGAAGTETRKLRRRREYHVRPAHHPHLGRSWYGAGAGRDWQGQRRQPAGSDQRSTEMARQETTRIMPGIDES